MVAHFLEQLMLVQGFLMQKEKKITEKSGNILREGAQGLINNFLSVMRSRRTVISIFGLQNCGKSTLLNTLLPER